MFRGANAIGLDAKGCFVMSSQYRDELASCYAGQLTVTISAVDPCLIVYPLLEWGLIEAEPRELPFSQEEARCLQQPLTDNAVDLELDGDEHFLIPSRLREYARLGKRAILVG